MLTFDDKYTLYDFGLIPLQNYDDPMTPNTERKTMTIPGRSGLWDFGTEIREKPFIFPVGLIEMDRIRLQQKLNAFVAFLFDDFGQPREIKMVRSYEPDKFYTVKMTAQITPERMIRAGRFDLPFVADEGYKFSNSYADEVTWGSEIITFEYNYLLGHESLGGTVNITDPQTLNLSVEGLAVQPIFEIDGTANNLTISSNGYEFTLPDFTDTSWEIDFEKYMVFRNGEETMIDIREFYLMPGDNEIQISGGNINLDMRIKFRDKYN